MTLERPALTAADVHALAATAFAPRPGPSWGLETELLVGRVGDAISRPGPDDVPAGVLGRGSRVTLEPGGQVEISTIPHGRVDAVLDTLAADSDELAARLARAGLEPWAGAVDRVRPPRRVLDLPRYRAMESFFDAGGPDGRAMMCNTASVQINVGHDPRDPAQRWRLLHRLGPVLVAAFAASPGRDRTGMHWASLRQRIWAGIDPGRTAPVDDGGDPADAWARYALAADVMVVHRPEGTIACPPGLSLARWMREGHPEAGYPSAADAAYHLTTLFPPIRPRGWLELRMLDAMPPDDLEVAVLVVAAALDDALTPLLLAELPETACWWIDAARYGLRHPGLAAAADLLFEAVVPALPRVTARPDRRDRVIRHRDERLRTRSAPGAPEVTRNGPGASSATPAAVPAPEDPDGPAASVRAP